eukprot:Gregarina_sp_Poly_1__618@NODE_1146_length_4945_cov_64_803813_g790_i0_p1_GENE_NODE_1146_length_4945_cov_64_803813_g790_i0NODE_1146_length_4945_cov_64_803813_g790_i0_p1_ORF_typecomplete_len644_score52_43Glyco_transf_92/PF01697_27/3_3e10Glyco_tranf_2_4/PF13704_6/6_9e05DPM3/PF08285_11/2_4_NODE_1146_length_4945_cov_64_803813_g790_i01002031
MVVFSSVYLLYVNRLFPHSMMSLLLKVYPAPFVSLGVCTSPSFMILRRWQRRLQRFLPWHLPLLGGCVAMTLFIWQVMHLPSRPQNAVISRTHTKYNVTLCAIVNGGIQYLPEWIEFHRMQGVEKFALYVVESSEYPSSVVLNLDIASLRSFFIARNSSLLDIYHMSSFLFESPQIFKFNASLLHRRIRNHCSTRYYRQSHWIGFLQPTEFLYPANVHRLPIEPWHQISVTLTDILMHPNKTRQRALRFPLYHFGAAQPLDLPVWLVPDSVRGETLLYFDPRGKTSYRDSLKGRPSAKNTEMEAERNSRVIDIIQRKTGSLNIMGPFTIQQTGIINQILSIEKELSQSSQVSAIVPAWQRIIEKYFPLIPMPVVPSQDQSQCYAKSTGACQPADIAASWSWTFPLITEESIWRSSNDYLETLTGALDLERGGLLVSTKTPLGNALSLFEQSRSQFGIHPQLRVDRHLWRSFFCFFHSPRFTARRNSSDSSPLLRRLLRLDQTKTQFASALRKRIGLQFTLVPKHLTFEVRPFETETGDTWQDTQWRISSRGLRTLCSPVETALGLQTPCPPHAPYLGRIVPHWMYPHPHHPLEWCSNHTQLKEDSPELWQGKLVTPPESILPCPGWPRMRCCEANRAAPDMPL